MRPGERKTRAIMFTDMKGYSAAMSRDETAALALIEEHNEILREAVARHGGQLVKFLGDGTLSCFESASDAVGCAIGLQRQLADRNAALPSERHIVLRIGIHLGDVTFRDGDAFGDGVNVAARVEPLAQPGGICITQTVYDLVKSRPEIHTTLLGPRELKNIAHAVTVYRVILDSQHAHPAAAPSRGRARLAAMGAVAGALVVFALAALAGWPREVPQDEPDLAASVAAQPAVPADPTAEVRAWLAERGKPLRVGVASLEAVGASDEAARALDLRLSGVLRSLPDVQVVELGTLARDALASAGTSAGADIVLSGTVGTLGSLRMVNLERLDVGKVTATVGARSYSEGSDDDVARAFPGMLRDVLVRGVQGASDDVVRRVISDRANQLVYCYERELKEDPDLEGRVEIGWRIDGSGRALDPRIVSDTTGNAGLTYCMLKKIDRWLFPVGAEGEVSWPFVFRAAE